MVMQRNYPDYNRISEIEKELLEMGRRLERAKYYDYDASDKEYQLEEELKKLIMGEMVKVEGKSCRENHCRSGSVYYPGKVHHLDGDTNNESFANLAMVCPKCQAHILLSRFSPEGIWLLKGRGLSNASIGRLLGISRERVRQLYKKSPLYRQGAEIRELARIAQSEERTEEEEAKLKAELDKLVRRAQGVELSKKYDLGYKAGRYDFVRKTGQKRLTDRRTWKKRILAELVKLGTNQAKGDTK